MAKKLAIYRIEARGIQQDEVRKAMWLILLVVRWWVVSYYLVLTELAQLCQVKQKGQKIGL